MKKVGKKGGKSFEINIWKSGINATTENNSKLIIIKDDKITK